MSETSVGFYEVSKRYRIGSTYSSISSLVNRKRRLSEDNKYHWALDNVSFELQPGEALGIIGPNGAGKTTILKLLSKVTYPTRGKIVVNGQFSALIELGAGFHPELTGRENIFLNATILGMRRDEIKSRFDHIVEFAGVGKYLDTPVKRYSSGMYARLGFSVAAHVDPEVLLVDEVLAVGDMAFRRKCYDRMKQLIQSGTTLVFVSHDFGAVQKVCSRCMVMYLGNVAFEGNPAEATAEYSNILRKAASEKTISEIPEKGGLSQIVMTHGAVIEEVQIVRMDGEPAQLFKSGEVVKVRIRVKFREDAKAPIFACTIRQPDGQIVYNFTTEWADIPTPDFIEGTDIIVEYKLELNLVGGTYHLGVDLARQDLSSYYDRIDRVMDFVVTGEDGSRGIANLKANFQVLDKEGEHKP